MTVFSDKKLLLLLHREVGIFSQIRFSLNGHLVCPPKVWLPSEADAVDLAESFSSKWAEKVNFDYNKMLRGLF